MLSQDTNRDSPQEGGYELCSYAARPKQEVNGHKKLHEELSVDTRQDDPAQLAEER